MGKWVPLFRLGRPHFNTGSFGEVCPVVRSAYDMICQSMGVMDEWRDSYAFLNTQLHGAQLQSISALLFAVGRARWAAQRGEIRRRAPPGAASLALGGAPVDQRLGAHSKKASAPGTPNVAATLARARGHLHIRRGVQGQAVDGLVSGIFGAVGAQ